MLTYLQSWGLQSFRVELYQVAAADALARLVRYCERVQRCVIPRRRQVDLRLALRIGLRPENGQRQRASAAAGFRKHIEAAASGAAAGKVAGAEPGLGEMEVYVTAGRRRNDGLPAAVPRVEAKAAVENRREAEAASRARMLCPWVSGPHQREAREAAE